MKPAPAPTLNLICRSSYAKPICVAAWVISGWFLLATTVSGGDEPAPRASTPADVEFFEKRIRPVLAENCFACHGEKKQQGGLRLDSLEALKKGSDNGPVVMPGVPDESTLIEAIRHDTATKMPPKKKLSDSAIADLTTWVKMGVPWPATADTSAARSLAPQSNAWKTHWAFQPVRDPGIPAVKDTTWPLTSIDPFLLVKLEDKGVHPSPSADRRTLLRRVTFDLIGLPPTPEEIAAYETDTSVDAFNKVVDRLLASPHYGERWGRFWLDVARYADTKGYVFLDDASFPWSFTYRDYVIRAFNEDLPYDRFVVEQLAADRLALKDDKRPLTALGFLTLGGRFMNNPQDILDDRIDVVTRGLMGLTVTCARCHDHKFDPIPTKDYYSLYGVFASSVEPPVPPTFTQPPKTEVYAKFAKELETREANVEAFLHAKQEELVHASRTRVAEYLLAAQAMRDVPNTDDFMLIADGSDLNPKMLGRWRVYLDRTRKAHHPIFAPWHALAALPADSFGAKAAEFVSRLVEAPDPAQPINPLVVAALAEHPPATLAEAAHIYARILNRIEAIWQDYARRAELNGAPARALPDQALEELRGVFHGPDSPPDIANAPFNHLELLPDRPSQGKLQELRKAIETWRATGPGAPPRAMVLEDAPTPVESRVFLRGNPNNLGDVVPRQFLGVLSGQTRQPFHEGSGRLELAKAIADRANPLTARVIVNRVWMQHFGAPLVGTPSDFGMRSDPPTHPDLLDHLATTFMRGGWSLKALHRRILLSAAYRQASDDRPDCRRIDPENTLLWRMNRRRLDFEAMRDALLAVSGRLDHAVGGPPLPDLGSTTTNRRTLYGLIDRLNLPGLFRTFDFPDPNATSPARSNTTVAPQALFLMNHPFVQAAARAVLMRPDVAVEMEPPQKIRRLYALMYGRAPSDHELELGRAFLNAPIRMDLVWPEYAQALLLSNEFAFVD
jgi:mono/diheme cytochrome c family protein